MKRKIMRGSIIWRNALWGSVLGLILFVAAVWGSSFPVYAEHFEGNSNWSVIFVGNGMESNFKTADINDAIYNLQPGDSIDITLTLKNAGEKATDWWMTNKVLRSLEDTQESAASGGYTYILIYQDPDGNQEILYSSETVGGEHQETAAVQGLHEATDALSEFFYLDTLYGGQQGCIFLTVVLDGETQGNGYQDTLADLTMNFAVEEPSNTVKKVDDTVDDPEKTPDSSDSNRVPPKTGDESRLMSYVVISLVSGLGLLVLALLSLRKSGTGKRGEREQ